MSNNEATTKPEISVRLSLEQDDDLITFLDLKAPQVRRVHLSIIAPNGYRDDAMKDQQMTSILNACLPIFRTREVVLVTGHPLSEEAMRVDTDVRNFHFEHSSEETYRRMIRTLGFMMDGGEVEIIVAERNSWISGHDGSILV